MALSQPGTRTWIVGRPAHRCIYKLASRHQSGNIGRHARSRRVMLASCHRTWKYWTTNSLAAGHHVCLAGRRAHLRRITLASSHLVGNGRATRSLASCHLVRRWASCPPTRNCAGVSPSRTRYSSGARRPFRCSDQWRRSNWT